MSGVFDPACHHEGHQVKPVAIGQAVMWRWLFEHHLVRHGKASDPCIPSAILFGGANGSELSTQLAELLCKRGVPASVVEERVQVVLDQIGRQAVTRAFRIAEPWREIKQLANQASPKVQLVLPSELQEAIQTRAKDGSQVGDKSKKSKQQKKQPKTFQLTAADVSVPEGVFRDQMNCPLQQVPFANIGPEARGLVVLNAAQAMPYIRSGSPISKQALAIIVLDHQGPLLHGIGELIRFPASCEKTSKAILLTAKLLQLGSIKVERVQPQEANKVDEVSNRVLRVVTYRDEFSKVPWKAFVSKPIRHIIDDIPCFGTDGHSPIIGVWDRQYLNDKLEKTTPEGATIFMACFRLEKPDDATIFAGSGKNGHYLEPRSEDGRSPHGAFRVIWLNKVDKQTVTVASQSTPQWNTVVRSGLRFGLRVRLEDAEVLHVQHKPTIPFLNSDKAIVFQAGPFPHGSNRAALSKLF